MRELVQGPGSKSPACAAQTSLEFGNIPKHVDEALADGVQAYPQGCSANNAGTQCRHEVNMNVDHLAGDLTEPSFGPRMVCTKCGTIGADARPNWREPDPFRQPLRRLATFD
jgi:hypothetical protein